MPGRRRGQSEWRSSLGCQSKRKTYQVAPAGANRVACAHSLCAHLKAGVGPNPNTIFNAGVFSNRRMSLKREGAGGEKGSFRDRFFSKYIAVAGRWECGNRAAISKVVGSPGFGLSTTVISTAGFPRSFHFHRPKAV